MLAQGFLFEESVSSYLDGEFLEYREYDFIYSNLTRWIVYGNFTSRIHWSVNVAIFEIDIDLRLAIVETAVLDNFMLHLVVQFCIN